MAATTCDSLSIRGKKIETLLYLLLVLSFGATIQHGGALPGSWEILMENAGIASMHTAVTHFGSVVLLDRIAGPTRLPYPRPECKGVFTEACTAHSALFDPIARTLRPLTIVTDTWCSSGQFLADGTLLQTGGDFNGLRKIRTIAPCPVTGECDWVQHDAPLDDDRWYASNQILSDGSVIIIGGRKAHTAEFYPQTRPLRQVPFLAATENNELDNLYPFVHLLPDGNFFVFANTRSILYNPISGAVLGEFPVLEGGPRTYPCGGSHAMLPLEAANGYTKVEVLVCGGSRSGVFLEQKVFEVAGTTCGRIVVTDKNPTWVMEDMPLPRIMGDMVILPTGDVLVINGAKAGSQGFKSAREPCLNPVLYRPNFPHGARFVTMTPTDIPRMYHSTANLLPDGRVLVAGSNPTYFYNFDEEFKTELRLEAFSPGYGNGILRPTIVAAPGKLGHGAKFDVEVTVALPVTGKMEVNLVSAPYATHNIAQGQRLLKLAILPPVAVAGIGGAHRYVIGTAAPPNGNVAPPGYYMLFVVNQGVPSVAHWVQILL